jgi:hypothetical protein
MKKINSKLAVTAMAALALASICAKSVNGYFDSPEWMQGKKLKRNGKRKRNPARWG